MTMANVGGDAAPTRREKHLEIMETITLMDDAIARLERLGHKAMQGSDAEVAKHAGVITDSISLGQFLDSYPGIIRGMVERCEILHNELEGTLF
jgi:hypothetical protein